MIRGETELYRPRAVVHRGLWEVGHLKLKVYGILAEGKDLSGWMVDDARSFVDHELPLLAASEGEDNGLGFVIIHPGEFGLTILGHWWIQGSVLCQHIRRQLWGATDPMDTATRPVIACVWELGLIHAEQEIWRDTMMSARPNSAAYLNARVAMTVV